jgi:ABC-type lipoprotein export system ATPase subunit
MIGNDSEVTVAYASHVSSIGIVCRDHYGRLNRVMGATGSGKTTVRTLCDYELNR